MHQIVLLNKKQYGYSSIEWLMLLNAHGGERNVQISPINASMGAFLLVACYGKLGKFGTKIVTCGRGS